MVRHTLPVSQVVLATVLGILGGIYIFRPLFANMQVEKHSSFHQKASKDNDDEL